MNPVARLQRLAFRMRIAVHVLALRRFRRDADRYEVVSNEHGELRFRPRCYCKPEIPDNWTPVYRTN